MSNFKDDKLRDDLLKAIDHLGKARLNVSAPRYSENPEIDKLHAKIREALDVAWEEYRENLTKRGL